MRNRWMPIVVILTVFLVLSESAMRWLEKQRSLIHEARSSFINALDITRVQLANHLHELSHDPILASDYSGQVSYAITRTLESEIRPGSFDFYVVYDETCKPIAKTSSIPVPPGLCQKQTSNQWHWYESNSQPLLFLLKHRTDTDKPFYIGAGRFINETWASSFPTLKSKLAQAHLQWGVYTPSVCKWPRFCSKFNTRVWDEGFTSDKLPPLASLTSTLKLFPVLRPWLIGLKPLNNPLALPLLFFIAILLIGEALQRRFSKTKEEDDVLQFLQWCKKPLQTRVQTPSYPWLQKAQESIVYVLSECANRSAQLTKASEHYESEMLQMKQALQNSERKQGEDTPHLILSSYIADSGAKLQDMIVSFQEESSDLASVIERGVLPHSRKLIDLLKHWQNGIAVRGERYFMRSLYEQEGKNEGESLLKSELNKIFFYTDQIHTTLLQSLTLLHKMQKQETQSLETLTAWSNLAIKSHSSNLMLNKIGELSAQLLQVSSQQRVSFLSNLPGTFTLKIPVPTLLGSFVILFSTMREGLRDAENETLVFQIHRRLKQEQAILALSVTNERGKVLICNPKENEIVRVAAILKPWNLQCQSIHRPEGGSYLLIRGPASLVLHPERESVQQLS